MISICKVGMHMVCICDVCMHACMHACIRVCVCVCVCVFCVFVVNHPQTRQRQTITTDSENEPFLSGPVSLTIFTIAGFQIYCSLLISI